MQLPNHKDLQTGTQAADGHQPPKQTSNDERRQQDLQIAAVRLQKEAGTLRGCRQTWHNKKLSRGNAAGVRPPGGLGSPKGMHFDIQAITA
jgi:hypothetical protein